VVVTENGCNGTSSAVNIGTGNPPANAGTIFGWNSFCPGEMISMNINNVSGATSYLWAINPPTAATIFAGQGSTSVDIDCLNQSFTITVTPQNACGNGGSSSEAMTVDNSGFCPIVSFGAYSTQTCIGSTVTFYNYSDAVFLPGGIPNWNFGAGATPATAIGNGPFNVTYSTAGPKTISLEYIDNFGFVLDGETRTAYINVTGSVSTSAISGNITLASCAGVTESYSVVNTPGSTYNWTAPAGSNIVGNGSSNVSITFNGGGGTVTVTETTAAGCIGTPVTIVVSCLTGIQSATSSSDFMNWNVYPNPTESHLELQFEAEAGEKIQWTLCDMGGRVLMQNELRASGGMQREQLDLQPYAQGMYLIRLQTVNGEAVKRVMKK
jgi:hypothetical protein